MKFLNKFFPQICIAIFCLIVISVWFKDGKLLATGEEGLVLANPDKSISIYKYSWNEVRAGGANPGSNVMVPFFYLESYVVRKGMPIWLFQATTLFTLMFIGSSSTYLLTKELLKNLVEKKLLTKLALISALFYILNPVSLAGIWFRFLLSFIFFYALAPLFLYLYIFGVNNKKYIFAIIAPLVTLLFLFSFSNAALVLLLWILPFIYSFSISWKRSFKPIVYFCATFLFWVFINYWWLYAWIEFSKTAYFADKNTLTHAIGTLKANSADFGLHNVVRLIHGGFFYRSEAFGSIYKSLVFLIFSWLIPITTIYGLWKLKHSQIKLFFMVSFTLLLFLAKGTSFPFGGLFLWLFSHISILQIFRNPLEKFGMLLPIVYAPLFGFGLFYFLSKFRNVKIKLIIFLLITSSLVAFHWPFFTGALARLENRDIRVEIPKSFQEANKVISEKDHIILSIPVMGGASGFHKWPYGYKGVETGQYLFNYPVVSEFYDATSVFGQILIGISNGYLNNLIGVAQFFSADIVAYRKDTDVLAFGYNLDALERSEKMIKTGNLNKIFDSPHVSLWSLPREKIVPVIYTPHSVRFGESPQELISLLENNQIDPKVEIYICTNKDKCNPYLQSQDISQIHIDAVPEKIEFKKLSPVEYDIKISNSKGRFLLAFNNTYHPDWKATVEGETIPSDNHIIANGYANGFIIDRVGDFNISLHFAPEEKIQKYYKISFMGIFLGIIVLFGSFFRNIIHRR